METLLDTRYRVVTVPQLEAMCKHVSGTCHRFAVEKVSRSRVHISYSNPNEYGHESPMVAVYPCYSSDLGVCVVLDPIRVLHDNWDGEGCQAFYILHNCPQIWRNRDGEFREYPLHTGLREIRDCADRTKDIVWTLARRVFGIESSQAADLPVWLHSIWRAANDLTDEKNAAEEAFENRLAVEVK